MVVAVHGIIVSKEGGMCRALKVKDLLTKSMVLSLKITKRMSENLHHSRYRLFNQWPDCWRCIGIQAFSLGEKVNFWKVACPHWLTCRNAYMIVQFASECGFVMWLGRLNYMSLRIRLMQDTHRVSTAFCSVKFLHREESSYVLTWQTQSASPCLSRSFCSALCPWCNWLLRLLQWL